MNHIRALGNVASHELRPSFAGILAGFGKAVAGKVNETANIFSDACLILFRECEEIDELRAARCFTGKGETGFAREYVDGGRLAGVGTTSKGDFRHGFGR